MKKLMMAAALATLASGCLSVNKNDGGNSCLKPCAVKDRVHVKYEVGKDRVQATDQLNCLFGFICWGSTAKMAGRFSSGTTITTPAPIPAKRSPSARVFWACGWRGMPGIMAFYTRRNLLAMRSGKSNLRTFPGPVGCCTGRRF